MPGILAKEEKFGLAPGSGDGSYIAANFGRSVKQKGGKVIGDTRLCTGDGGRAAAESEQSARAEGLALYQVVAQSPDVGAPFERVVIVNLGPNVHHVDVGFAAVPRLRGGVPHHQAGAVGSEASLHVNGHHAAGERIIQVGALDAQLSSRIRAVVGLVRRVAVMADPAAHLCDKGGRKDMRLVDRPALFMLHSGAHKSASGARAA